MTKIIETKNGKPPWTRKLLVVRKTLRFFAPRILANEIPHLNGKYGQTQTKQFPCWHSALEENSTQRNREVLLF